MNVWEITSFYCFYQLLSAIKIINFMKKLAKFSCDEQHLQLKNRKYFLNIIDFTILESIVGPLL